MIAYLPSSFARTITGIYSSQNAYFSKGQYIVSFSFHGNAVIKYLFEPNQNNIEQSLYFFLDDDWKSLTVNEDCLEKLKKARFHADLLNSTNEIYLPIYEKPKIWHIIYIDKFSCLQEMPTYITNTPFKLILLNPDSLNNPTVHFSDDENGLCGFYQLMSLAYFLIFCICGPHIADAMQKEGPMHYVIKLLTVSTVLQSVDCICMVIHLRKYAKDGIGSAYLEVLAEFFDLLSQFVVLYMLLTLSLGWSFKSSTKNLTILQQLKDKLMVKLFVILCILQSIVFIWEQYEDRKFIQYHANRSWVGVFFLIIRITLAFTLSYNVSVTSENEKSVLKRSFYTSFTHYCSIWFLSYPAFEIISWSLSAYVRYKFVMVMVLLSQSVAVAMLYRLFLSRSLYWEVSALSSSLLPLYSSKPQRQVKLFLRDDKKLIK